MHIATRRDSSTSRVRPDGRLRSPRRVGALLLVFVTMTAMLALVAPSRPAHATAPLSATAAQAHRIVENYEGVWTSPPTHVPSAATADGPMMGNGDVGVVMGGDVTALTSYLGKNDFFALKSGYCAINPLGRIVLAAPGLAGASYRMVQDIADAEVRGTFALAGTTLKTTSWVDANANLYVLSLSLTGAQAQSVSLDLRDGAGAAAVTSVVGDVLVQDAVSGPQSGVSARTAARVVGHAATVSGNSLSLTLLPGESATLVVGIASSVDGAAYQSDAVALVSGLDLGGISAAGSAHRDWWSEYWAKSFVDISRKGIEKSWYGSLYLLGSTSRSGETAPGLWGSWITGQMNWSGDYHLNYNHQTPFMAGLVTNHLDQMEPYDASILDYLPAGRRLAKKWGLSYPGGWNASSSFKAVDGDTAGAWNSASIASTTNQANAWWQVDLGATHAIDTIEIFNRTDAAAQRLSDYWVFASDTPFAAGLTPAQQSAEPGVWSSHQTTQAASPTTIPVGASGRYVMVQLNGTNILHFAEVRVLDDGVNVALEQETSQSSTEPTASGYRGVIYPVGIGPSTCTGGAETTHAQKSNAAYAAMPMIAQFYATHDEAYAEKIYDYLEDVGDFWQQYLGDKVDGRYVIKYDAAQEQAGYQNSPYVDKDPMLSIAFAKYLFQALIDTSTLLDQDADRRAGWQDIIDNLAPYPTIVRNGETVFSWTADTRLTYPNSSWDAVTSAIAMGYAIGLDSEPELVEIARETVKQKGVSPALWHSFNSPTTFFTAAARVGYDPEGILANMAAEAAQFSYPNMAIVHGGGGIENLNVVTSGLSEMLLQSFQGDVKVFANWPQGESAKFGDLRAFGGFLVSSERAGDAVRYVRAVSESGQELTMTNPWPGQSVELYRDGVSVGTLSGDHFTVPTTEGETIDLAPAGTSFAEISTMLAQPARFGDSATNAAAGKPAWQSSTFSGRLASRAVDGNESGDWALDSVSSTNGQTNAWWQVDLGSPHAIEAIEVFNRTDAVPERLTDFWVFVSAAPFDTTLTPEQQAALPGVWSNHQRGRAGSPTSIPMDATGRYVMVQLSGTNYLSLAEVRVLGVPDLAAGKTATQSSTASGRTANLAVDGRRDGCWLLGSVTSTASQANAWWKVDLGGVHDIDTIKVFNRTDAVAERLSDYWVFVSESPFATGLTPVQQAAAEGVWSSHQTTQAGSPTSIPVGASGRYVMIQLGGTDYLSLAEVQVVGDPVPVRDSPNVAEGKAATQSSTFSGRVADRAVDGNVSGDWALDSVSSTNSQANAWWRVDLGATYSVDVIDIFNRTDAYPERLTDYWVFVSSTPFDTALTPPQQAAVAGVWSSHQTTQGGIPTSIPTAASGRYVMVQLSGTGELSLAEVRVFGVLNLAVGKSATQSSTFSGRVAARAVDGNTSGNWALDSVSSTNSQANAWWQVDLSAVEAIAAIEVFNRTDAVPERLSDYWVFVSETPFSAGLTPTQQAAQAGVWSHHATVQAGTPTSIPVGVSGRYVMVQLNGTNYLSLAEVRVLAVP